MTLLNEIISTNVQPGVNIQEAGSRVNKLKGRIGHHLKLGAIDGLIFS